jgi:hypothetical protein
MYQKSNKRMRTNSDTSATALAYIECDRNVFKRRCLYTLIAIIINLFVTVISSIMVILDTEI